MLAIERYPFVGREDEIASLTSLLDDVESGQGRMALLSGEPGIGKTRIVEELERIASMKGFAVFRGKS